MNPIARKFFEGTEDIAFKEVLFLSENLDMGWAEISKRAPDLSRGWFELSRLSARDRVDFTREFWLDRMPYHPRAHPAFFEFFEQLDDVEIVTTRLKDEEFFSSELIYSLSDNSCFFRGRPAARDEEIHLLYDELGVNLPRDYLSFAKIHSGFGKLSEMGLLEIGEIAHTRRRVMDLLIRTDHHTKSGNRQVDPGSLIPFYEALGLSSFQCFYTDWYPGSEMGNVYLSGIDYTVSDVSHKTEWSENLAFPTFSEWLTYYLEGMNLCI